MTRVEIISEVEKVLNVRYAWSKPYGICGIMQTEYTLFYNRRARKPLAWLQIGFCTTDDKVINACIIFNLNGEGHEIKIEKVEDIAEILKKIVP